MQNYAYAQRRAALKRPSEFGMSAYDWALAKQRMDEAMILGDLTLRAFARARTILRGVSKTLGGLF